MQAPSKPLFLMLSLILTIQGCSETPAKETITQESETLEVKDSIPTDSYDSTAIQLDIKRECLDINFLEGLERFSDPMALEKHLAEKGFGKLIVEAKKDSLGALFMRITGEEIAVEKRKYQDGMKDFNLEYRNFSVFEIECLEEKFRASGYELKNGLYTKKGMGSYQSKVIRFDKENVRIAYAHNTGKELSAPLLKSVEIMNEN